MRFRTESGQCLFLGLLTLGKDAGKEVNRNLVVVGDDVSTLPDSNVVSNKVLAVVGPVLCHFDVDFSVDPKFLVGVIAWGDATNAVPVRLSKFAASCCLEDTGVVFPPGPCKLTDGVVGGALLIGDCLCGSGARRRFTADEGVELDGFFIEPGGLILGRPGVFVGSSCPILRGCFRTVPGGFTSYVSKLGRGRKCFLPETSPMQGSISSQSGPPGSVFSSSSKILPHESSPSRNNVASNEEWSAATDEA